MVLLGMKPVWTPYNAIKFITAHFFYLLFFYLYYAVFNCDVILFIIYYLFNLF